MKFKLFALLSIFFIILLLNKNVSAGEPLVKYRYLFITDPATGLRVKDGSREGYEGIDGAQNFTPFDSTNDPSAQKFRIGTASFALDHNSPEDGNPDDCYPDDPNNPEGNIVLSGRIISNFNNKPINGAVVAVYMGAEQQKNLVDGFGFWNEKFFHGGKDFKGRLTNLYTYDITKDGFYRVYACNGYKQLSAQRKDELKKFSPNLFNNGPCVADGYTGDSTGCNFFDYTKLYPKFSLAVVCGLNNIAGSAAPAPQIGEILSIDNYNNDYKSANNQPSYMFKNNLDIRVNCDDTIQAFPLPLELDYRSGNVASCRMDDISPNLRNYYTRVQSDLKNDFTTLDKYTAPGSTLIPDDSSLTCSNPDDIFCLKNFLTKSFPKPQNGVNIYDYKDKVYLDPSSANKTYQDKSLVYASTKNGIKVDLSDREASGVNDYIPLQKNSEKGQIDAKEDFKSYISDYSFDLNVLKDLYACFTTFNAPPTRSSATQDEVNRQKFTNKTADLNKEFYENNLRIPSCKELYCGSEFVPDNRICKVKKPEFEKTEKFGFNFTVKNPNEVYYQINALSGYGPGVTLNFRSVEEITNDLMLLSKQLIDSDFNPKKSIPGANLLYKPVSKIGDIVACMDDSGNPVYLNDGTINKEGSITYRYENQQKTFFSPVPFMSFISVPYYMQLFHSVEGDNYGNVKTATNSSKLFPEQCNSDTAVGSSDKTQTFANCRKAVIPGGVYSISALRVVAKYCNEVFKIPTPDAANLPKADPLTSVKTDSWSYKATSSNSLEVDLSITRLGSPLSLCLCSVSDPDCNLYSKLNNNFNSPDYAVSSFVGDGTQNEQGGRFYSVLGYKCENKFKTGTKDPLYNCQEQIDNVDQWKIENTSSDNYLGSTNNLKIQWPFSMSEINTDEAHTYLTYTHTGGEAPKEGNYKPWVLSGTTSWQEASLSNDYEKGTVPCRKGQINSSTGKLECIDPVGINVKGIGLERTPYQISSIVNRVLDPYNGVTEIPFIGKLDQGAGQNNDYVSPAVSVYQNVSDGTVGDAQSRFRFRNAKYDPIPDLLNDFRRYSVVGVFAGDYCKTPKMGSTVDIKFSYFDSNNVLKNSDTPIVDTSYTAGKHCNTYIPDELDRCDDEANIPQKVKDDADANGISHKKACRIWRCLSFCFQDSGVTYKTTPLIERAAKDPERPDFFCRNINPLNGVELQANKGDEGCIYDFVTKIKQAYANPAELDQNYKSVADDPRYSKSNYPVFNNNLCINPSLTNPLDPNYRFNVNNCKRDVYSQTKVFRDVQETGRTIKPIIAP